VAIKLCPKCGKPVKDGILCDDCSEATIGFKPIRIKLCPSKKYFYKGSWKKFEDLFSLSEKLIHDNVEQRVNLIQGLDSFEDILSKNGFKDRMDLIVEFKGLEYKVPVDVEVTLSPGVSKLGGTYFEGILQLRNATDIVKKYVKNYLAKNFDREIYINKIVDKGDLFDYYFIDKRKINNLALKIIRNFGGYISNNPQLFSHNKLTSRDLYRLNTLVFLPNFAAGDVVLFNERPLLIVHLSKIINATNLIDGKRVTFSFDQKNQNNFKVMKRLKTTISRVKPDLEILNPDDYQSVPVRNFLEVKVVAGKTVFVVEHNGVFYIVR
jgi:NMD protein affecting ribosome stability and mRNA decay